MRQLKNESGIGLVEVILALGVSVIVITSMVSLAVFTVRSSLTGRLLFEGTKYANQQLEYVRSYRDSPTRTWAQFRSDMSVCSSQNCYMAFSSGNIVNNVGTNVINATTPSQVNISFRASTPISGQNFSNATVIRIAATSQWSVGNVQKNAYVYTDLSNWRGR